MASAVGPPGAHTPGSGRMEHDLHPAAPPPRLHECADREPRPGVGIAPRAGVPVLRGWLGRLRGGRHRVPHGVHPRDGGQHRAGGCERVLGRGEGPVAPEKAPDLGELRALPPMEAGGPPERGCRAIPPAKGLVECGARHCQAMGDALQGRKPPPRVRARVRPVEEASHEDVLQAEEAGERPLEGVERVGDGREGPLRASVVGGQRAAPMGEPEAEGQRRVTPRQPAARPLLPGP